MERRGFRYHSDQAKLHDYLGVYPNPYDYGYIIEIENADTLEPALNRHLAMGRFSHENATGDARQQNRLFDG